MRRCDFKVNVKRAISCAIAEVVASTTLLHPQRAGWRVLMFHSIGSPALEDRQGLFSIKPELFREYLAVLVEKGGRVVPFSPAVLASEGPRLSITFDDGYRDNLEVAAPMLAELGLPFTVFVPSEFVRQKRPGFMTPEMLRRLAALPGACVGAHGAGHVKLTGCDDSQLQSELVSSRHYLEDVLGAPVETMAYPYGAVDQRVRNATEAAGYVLAACSHAGLNDGRRDPLLIRRTEILSPDTVRLFRQKLAGHWDWYRWRTTDPARL